LRKNQQKIFSSLTKVHKIILAFCYCQAWADEVILDSGQTNQNNEEISEENQIFAPKNAPHLAFAMFPVTEEVEENNEEGSAEKEKVFLNKNNGFGASEVKPTKVPKEKPVRPVKVKPSR
jgi:hypothetical protein